MNLLFHLPLMVMSDADAFRNFDDKDYVDENGEFIADGSAAENQHNGGRGPGSTVRL